MTLNKLALTLTFGLTAAIAFAGCGDDGGVTTTTSTTTTSTDTTVTGCTVDEATAETFEVTGINFPESANDVDSTNSFQIDDNNTYDNRLPALLGVLAGIDDTLDVGAIIDDAINGDPNATPPTDPTLSLEVTIVLGTDDAMNECAEMRIRNEANDTNLLNQEVYASYNSGTKKMLADFSGFTLTIPIMMGESELPLELSKVLFSADYTPGTSLNNIILGGAINDSGANELLPAIQELLGENGSQINLALIQAQYDVDLDPSVGYNENGTDALSLGITIDAEKQ